MKINYLNKFLCILAFIWTTITFSQVTVSIADLKVDGVSAQSIDIGSKAKVTMTCTVKVSTLNGDPNNILGNLWYYIKKKATDDPTPLVLQSVTFVRTDPPFVNQTTYTAEFPYSFEFTGPHWFPSGGAFYVEYVNNNNDKFKSNSISVIGGTASTSTTNPNSFKILNVKNVNNELFQDKIYLSSNEETSKIYITFQHTISAGSDIQGWYYVQVMNKNGATVDYVPWFSVDGTSTGATSNYYNDFDLPSSYFTDGGSIKIWYNGFAGGFTSVNSYPVQSISFTSKDIYTPEEVMQGQVVNFAADVVYVKTGKTFDPRFNIYRDVVAPVDKNKWYKKENNGNWTLFFEGEIPPPLTIVGFTQFFRRAYYKGAYADSNIVSVKYTPISSLNTICCDQSIPVGGVIQPIMGNVPNIGPHYFTWEKYTTRGGWGSIPGSAKDYTPTTTGQYRRVAVATPNTGRVYFSNIVTISNAFARLANLTENESENMDVTSDISIFPNPSSSLINIVSNENILKEKMSFFDISGRQVQPNYINGNDNEIVFDISNLPNGIYLLSIEGESGIINKKIIKN